MNYWITPTGRVFEGETGGGSWHLRLLDQYCDDNPDISDKFWKWMEEEAGYGGNMVEFFEKCLGWVRYCDWGNLGWIVNCRLTRQQKDKIFLLTNEVL